jgi:hypothetical protein
VFVFVRLMPDEIHYSRFEFRVNPVFLPSSRPFPSVP